MADLIAIGRKKTPQTPAPEPPLPEVAPDEIHVTARAASKIREKLEQEGFPHGVFRVGIMGGGCSGLTYLFAVEPGAESSDVRFTAQGVTVVVDPKSLQHLGGTALDWHAELGKSGFRMRNPHVRSACSCGASFSL